MPNLHRAPSARGPRIAFAVAAAAALLLGSCSAGGGEKSLTPAQLKTLLPPASDVGSGYKISPPDNSNNKKIDAAMSKACPDAEKLGGTGNDSTDIERDYDGPDNKSFEVSFDPDAKSYSNSELSNLVDAVNKCKAITYTDSGQDVSIHIHAANDGTYGDQGITLQLDLTLTSSQISKPIHVTAGGVSYRLGKVGVTVEATDGIDENTLASVPRDSATVATLAASLQAKVKKLEG